VLGSGTAPHRTDIHMKKSRFQLPASCFKSSKHSLPPEWLAEQLSLGTKLKEARQKQEPAQRERARRRCEPHGRLWRECPECNPSRLFKDAARLNPVKRPERELTATELELARMEVAAVNDRMVARTEAKQRAARKRARQAKGWRPRW
jgi:hypothetical protein